MIKLSYKRHNIEKWKNYIGHLSSIWMLLENMT